MNTKKTFFTLLLTAILLFSVSCTKTAPLEKDRQIKIVTTVFPLYDFARNVVGDYAEIYLLLPSGSDPHSWEPKPSDIKKVADADLFIYIGAGLEPWMESVKEVLKKDAIVIDSSYLVDLKKSEGHEEHDEQKEENDEEEHLNEEFDPHLWLNFNNDIKIVSKITKELIFLYPDEKEEITKNAEDYIEKLNELDQEYINGLSKCNHKIFITGGHSAFGYLAEKYGLEQIAVAGLNPNAEPSPQKLVEIVEIAKKEKINYIFFETLVSPKVSEVISKEIGAKTLLLNPGHSDNNNDSFLDIMKFNLDSLRQGLECE